MISHLNGKRAYQLVECSQVRIGNKNPVLEWDNLPAFAFIFHQQPVSLAMFRSGNPSLIGLLVLIMVPISLGCSTVPTENGTQGAELCVFPFSFEGITFTSCTDAGDPNGIKWCSVGVDDQGVHLPGQGRWGHCDKELCPKSFLTKIRSEPSNDRDQEGSCIAVTEDNSEEVCVFPFQYNGKVYNGCTAEGDPEGHPWCSLRTDEDGVHISGNWGHCTDNCLGRDPIETQDECKEVPEIQLPTSGTYLPDYDACGKASVPGALPKVIGGFSPGVGDFPFPVMLGRKSSFFCGGSLINRMYVLTAAHCVKGRPPTVITVGEHTVGRDCDCSGSGFQKRCAPKPQRIPVADVVSHPGYRTGKDDIALIRLSRPARLSVFVQLVCLPHDSRSMASMLSVSDILGGLEGKPSTVMGWGATRNRAGLPLVDPDDPDAYDTEEYEQYYNDETPFEQLTYDEPNDAYDETDGETYDQDALDDTVEDDGVDEDDGNIEEYAGRSLQAVSHPVILASECRSLWGSYRQKDQVCAGRNGKSSCFGDSGGPLVVQSDDGTMFQIGVVSFGARRCAGRKPSVYTRVSPYVDWIRENLRN
eukprot:maker-scaffold1402_size43054-snap-gene-0.7 protein:Tk02459 transcript:maker-scaffold1402_size43054-snap-gene-0.7-mRNA-1 annotation:"hemolymph proteinase 24"